MSDTSGEDSQFLEPFYRIRSNRKVWPEPRRVDFSCRLQQHDLRGDRDRRWVLLHFASAAAPAPTCKVKLVVNGVQLTDAPLKTTNVTGYVKAGMNVVSIMGAAVPEDLRVGVLVVDRADERDMLASLADGGDGATAKAPGVVADGKENEDAVVDCVGVSLNCPLKRARLVVPCRGLDCRHAQCFDALPFLRLNEAAARPAWRCPVCDRDADVRRLRVDPFMLDVLLRAPKCCDSVRLLGEGRWTAAAGKSVDVIWIQESPARPLAPVNRKLDTSVVDLTNSFSESVQL